MGCNGNCDACSGCGKALELTKMEMDFLLEMAEVAFLPLVRTLGEETPVIPGREGAAISRMLQVLEKKDLISLDYDQPLKGFAYPDYPIRGSVALTRRGQLVLELMEYQGIRD